jgi:hypothetical protein
MSATKVTNSSKALKLFNKLEKTGDLINVYSDIFFKRIKNLDKNFELPFNGKDIEVIKNNKNYDKIKNHLLFIFINEYKKDINEELKIAYPHLQKFFINLHLPDFILLNNNTKQMLCVGLGRKNKLFIIDSKTNTSIKSHGFFPQRIDSSILSIKEGDTDQKYINQFTEKDVLKVVKFFLKALDDLSLAMFEFDHLPGSFDSINQALNKENIKDGLHYIEGVDEGYTTDEINQLIIEYDFNNDNLNEALEKIRIFFPQCEIGELNTGDY